MAEPTPKSAFPRSLSRIFATVFIVVVWFSIIGLTTSMLNQYRRAALVLPATPTNDKSIDRLYALLTQWGDKEENVEVIGE